MSTPVSSPDRTSLLTPDEVAGLLKVTKRQVRHLAAVGRLERVTLGARTVRYTPDSVQRLIRPTTSEGRPAQATSAKLGVETADHESA